MGCLHMQSIIKHTNLQEGGFLQHADELRKIVSNLFIHSPDQTDLPHGPGTVSSLGICPLHLQARQQWRLIRPSPDRYQNVLIPQI